MGNFELGDQWEMDSRARREDWLARARANEDGDRAVSEQCRNSMHTRTSQGEKVQPCLRPGGHDGDCEFYRGKHRRDALAELEGEQ
ncbi:hypothetical protein SEA_CLOWN_91 [Gordonia phage Clown]|uniref:Uncharacterized protein n=1 Tax=Gordonia phage Clown TaxID=2759393 RepID=A0A7L7STQ7_9CAUD|nr:hypothetical protein KNV25_gp91 [Gordonia phage Clown]QOC56089.1 hypothetical protein SEA_CLOWN_91 [Gordonia phage Clown]